MQGDRKMNGGKTSFRTVRCCCVLVAFALCGLPTGAVGQTNQCGDLSNAFGPFDYRTARDADKKIVELHHFNNNVESLTRGVTDYIGADLDYTLRVFPNHVRALWTLSRLSRQENKEQPQGTRWTVDCYFERAIRFQPDDGEVRMVYGLHLLKIGDKTASSRELEKAAELSKGNAQVHYNLGLAYFELGNYEQAMAQAKLAYALQFPLPGLRDKLKRAGKWQE
jgi:tetratricopeptide (TPR) repeat protein